MIPVHVMQAGADSIVVRVKEWLQCFGTHMWGCMCGAVCVKLYVWGCMCGAVCVGLYVEDTGNVTPAAVAGRS